MPPPEVTRLDLHKIIMESGKKSMTQKKEILLDFLSRKLNLTQNADALKSLSDFLQKRILWPYLKRWTESSRNNERFISRYQKWLTESITFPELVIQHLPGTSTRAGTFGRPEKEFHTSSGRSRRRKIQAIKTSSTTAELVLAASMSLREEGDTAAAKLVTEITTTTPTRAKRVLSKWRKKENVPTEMTVEEALSLIISSELTKSQYMSLRSTALSHGHELYPSYDRILQAKMEAYPEGVTTTETMCEVNLQSLLNQTASRILACVSSTQVLKDEIKCTLICKYGFDGSSGHSQYKQMWQQVDASDEFLFMSSLVPLRLNNVATGDNIWENPRPSSTRFCRPIRFQWKKETKDIAKAERNYIQKQIDDLKDFHSGIYSIKFCLLLTMINGKVCNALTESGNMRCYICGAKASEMNNLREIKGRTADVDKYSFGLSTLHCHIRFFECILHISYRLEFKRWQARGSFKLLLTKKKALVQKLLREKMGLIVDVPRPGSGNSNDGNTARRFFDSSKLAARLTGINEDLIKRFSVILKAISSGLQLNDVAFAQYCLRTAELYVELYPWYCMPPTVHKVLLHGSEISKNAILPLGELSEEALEARNKDTRKFRERFTRKHSRVATNEDLFKRLLLTSDPLLSSFTHLMPKKRRRMSKELRDLLIVDEQEEELFDSQSSSDEHSSDD